MHTIKMSRPLFVLSILTLGSFQLVASAIHPSSVPGIEVEDGFDAEIVVANLEMPFGMARDTGGNIVVGSNCAMCAALKVSPAGAILGSSDPIFDPDGVAVDPNGRVLVTAGFDILVANSFMAGMDDVLAPGFDNLNDIVVDGTGQIFAYENNGGIWPVSPTGMVAAAPLATTAKGEGISLDPVTGGLLATSGSPSEAVLAISPGGTVTTLAPMPADSLPQDAEQGSGGPFGNMIYVTVGGTGEILTLDRASGITTPFATGFMKPARLLFEGQGGLLVSDLDAGRIVRIFPLEPPEPPEPEAVEVRFDIVPGCFNPNGHGALPVAIFGSEDLDVGDIDFESVSLSGLTVMSRGRSGRLKVAFQFIDDDAYLDALVHFEDNGAWTGVDGTATLTGLLMDGTPIEGTDSTCIVPDPGPSHSGPASGGRSASRRK